MATAPPPTNRPRQARRPAAPPAPRWRRWLVLGLFFGLGYGLTQRLMEVRWGEGSPKPPSFKAKSTPSGTTLEELRDQKGEKAKPLAADLEELARKQREEKEKKEKDAAAVKEESEEEKPPIEQDEQPSGTAQSPTLEPSTPTAPQLPPPPPVPIEQTPPPAAQTPGEVPATLP